MFINTIEEAGAEGRLKDIYNGDHQAMGYVPNYATVRPAPCVRRYRQLDV
jgi:hypothetical protein